METKIQETLGKWFPNAFNERDKISDRSDYEVLRQFARYTLKLIQENGEKEKEPFMIINMIYQNGSLHDKNAIENEFLYVFANEESPGTLKSHMGPMPDNLKPIYLKTILEN
jgi:hypothetical protein